MAKSDGFHNKITKIQKTRILPLRWIGNLCGEISANSLVKAFDLEEDGNFGYRFKFHCKVWHYFNKPYQWWGTSYLLDTKDWLDQIKTNVASQNWDDYDEDGIAYWEKVTDSESKDS
jgi:hypothetical protein